MLNAELLIHAVANSKFNIEILSKEPVKAKDGMEALFKDGFGNIIQISQV